MPLKPDDTVCFCFHVTLRKIETFCAVEKPKVASQISECLSAGTGCGWCVPMLRHLHKKLCGEQIPWWRQTAEATDEGRAGEELDPAAYREGRRKYIGEGKGKPPPGAEG